jgi:lipid-A-disaccharide synthase
LSPNDRVLALFPGSREQEIERHLDAFVGAARELQRRDPALKVVVSVAPHVSVSEARCPFPMVRSASFTIFRAADAALCKSGTTTLEAAVTGCPLAVAYRTSPITYAAAKWLVKIPNIGLVNVVAGYRLAPEFVQDALQPFAVADALSPLLDPASEERRKMLAGLAAVRTALGVPGAAARAATMAIQLAGPGGNGR